MNLFVSQEPDHWHKGSPSPDTERRPPGEPLEETPFMQSAACQRANGGRRDDIMWICESTNSQTARPMSGLGNGVTWTM
ncbi:hypothetical protein EYF80_026160 [Liparis tanakae]|uniref:Uncharacterized protein n=1 Tax=Liparis tanakae TaxID=230148 RepID=A0A4Z2HFC7_9TELE|nr:hypothetical protein EYF80_026160 [Liparis tanakae]